MSGISLTEQEKAAFCQDVTKDRALDYFYVLGNVPLHFIYHDKVMPGHLSELERRNKAITETLWLEAYHQYLIGNVSYRFLYRGSILQMAFQVHQVGAGTFAPPAAESRAFQPTVEAVQANFDDWMDHVGWQLADELRKEPPRASWQTLLGVPDRTVRIVSLMPVGNQVVLELITTWTDNGVLKEAAWAVVLVYDVDGTVLQDRSYIDLTNWPSARNRSPAASRAPGDRPLTTGVGELDRFYKYHRSQQLNGVATVREERNLSIIEGAWVDAQNTDLNAKIIHPERFRTQLPVQKWSGNLDVTVEIEAVVRKAAPDRKVRLGMTYAKGNQVATEGVVSWTEDGHAREAPFISFLLLDDENRVIRERRYITLNNWPGAAELSARLAGR